MVTKEDGTLKIINPKDAHKELEVEPHTLRFTNRFVYNDGQVWPLNANFLHASFVLFLIKNIWLPIESLRDSAVAYAEECFRKPYSHEKVKLKN